MNIVLKRNVNVHCFDILIDMGVQTNKRPDIVAVTKHARELGGRITASEICKNLIHRPDAIAAGENILVRCQDLRLLDGNGSLTEEGRRTADEETVFMPERGTYRAWFTTDPLLPQTLISIQPIKDGRVQNEVYSNGKGKDEDDNMVELPQWILDTVDEKIRMLGNGTIIKIYSMEDIGRNVEKHTLSVQLTLSIPQYGEPSLTATSSKWEEKLNVADLEISISFEDVFQSMLGEKSRDWTGSHLQSSYDSLTDAERTRFRTDVDVKGPSFHEFGSFNDTTVREVPIAPQTFDDAEQWARFLLLHRIDEYLHPNEYERTTQEILNRDEFTYFAGKLTLPDQEGMSAVLGGYGDEKPKEYWYLQAPIDLMPTEGYNE